MHRDILPQVIFSPANLAVSLAEGLQKQGVEVVLFSPGPVDTKVRTITADLSYFEAELKTRGDTYTDLLKKHPFTFITLARQVQGELIAKAYEMANRNELDLVHIYTNEEELAVSFASLCNKPVVFTHHDPFNYMVKYKNFFPKYEQCNWISMSLAQRSGMPATTHWVANIYHGLTNHTLRPATTPTNDYIAYFGRIIQPKGVHLAIAAVQRYNYEHPERPFKLKLAGKHYAGHKKDTYWQSQILPELDDPAIEYVGFLNNDQAKQDFLANAAALLVPSLFTEPFGLVNIEAMACGTPVIGLDSGALPEVITHNKTGYVVQKPYNTDGELDEPTIVAGLASAMTNLHLIDRQACRLAYESRFTAERMCHEHLMLYRQLI